MEKPNKRSTKRAAKVAEVAAITGVSKRHVYRVLSGDQENEEVLSVYMFLHEGENKLLQAAKQLLPFDKQYKSATQRKQPKELTAGNLN